MQSTVVPVRPQECAAAPEILNREVALATVEGDEGLLADMARLFLDGCDSALAAIRDAIVQQDCPRVALGAHAFKGSLSSLAATEARKAAAEVELEAIYGQCEQGSAAYDRLAAALARLRPALEDLCRAAGPDAGFR